MNANLSLITCLDDMPHDSAEGRRSLELDPGALLSAGLVDTEVLNGLSFRISKKPACLFAHVQRIYCCFAVRNGERLYGALVDMLLVLNKRGWAISRRLIAGSRSVLSREQVHALLYYCGHEAADIRLLPGNRYSVFSKGLTGTPCFMQTIDNASESDLDPLVLARDFIEYSQLDEARNVLEEAILEQPDRQELHDELLALYRSTRDQANFAKMYHGFVQTGISVPPAWEQMALHFQQ